MKNNNNLRVLYKTFFGILGLVAVGTEILAIRNQGDFHAGNFFSFFTIQSNIFAAIILLASAHYLFRGKRNRYVELLRGPAALYMVITGIVFSVLLSGLEETVLNIVPWDNTLLHYIMPIVVFADWILDPPTEEIRYKDTLVWLLYPMVFLIYSMVRGAVTSWYPYSFLNPDGSGFGSVFAVSMGILAIGLVVNWFLILLPAKTPAIAIH